MVAWQGTVAGGLNLKVVWCGHDRRFGVNNVATTAAAVTTYAAVAAFGSPDLVMSVGTAGGFSQRGAAIGDVFLATKSVFHSRRIPDMARGQLEEYGFGHFRSPPLNALARAARLKQGVVSTSDSLDCSAVDMDLMMAEGAVVKEMECAAVAWVCEQLNVPFTALKAITDIVDGAHPTREEFEANLHAASAALQERTAAVLTLLAGTSLSAWAAGTGAIAAPPGNVGAAHAPGAGAPPAPPPAPASSASASASPAGHYVFAAAAAAFAAFAFASRKM